MVKKTLPMGSKPSYNRLATIMTFKLTGTNRRTDGQDPESIQADALTNIKKFLFDA